MQRIRFPIAAFAETDFPIYLVFMAATVAVGLLFIVLVAWLATRQKSKNREMEHLERMKAIESGQPIGPSTAEKMREKYLHNAFWISFWIGAGVPIAAVWAASSVMVQARLQGFGILLAIWICVAIISIASVVSSAVLMILCGHWSTKGEKNSSGNGSAV